MYIIDLWWLCRYLYDDHKDKFDPRVILKLITQLLHVTAQK